MKKEYVKFIKDELKKNKTLPVLNLTTMLNDKYKTIFNRSHIRRVIRDNNINLKQTKIRREPKRRFGKPVDIKKQLKDFYKKASKGKNILRKNQIGERHKKFIFKIGVLNEQRCKNYNVVVIF